MGQLCGGPENPVRQIVPGFARGSEGTVVAPEVPRAARTAIGSFCNEATGA